MLSFYNRGLDAQCQILFFSATYDEPVMKFASAIVSDAIIIKLRREEQSLDNIKQFYVECADKNDKFAALSNIYGTISVGQSMIFCHVSSFFIIHLWNDISVGHSRSFVM